MVTKYRVAFQNHLQKHIAVKEPENLYKPIEYILSLEGKKLRPILVLLATDTFGADYKKALDIALAVEIFHNFTLVHDDIMDNAPLRRGKTTIHEKWDVNTGILSGDAMLILAYQYLENYDAETFKKLAQLFSKTGLEVCEGQQMDIDFETSNDVSIEDYLKMITLKTSVLVAATLKMGAIVANATEEESRKIYNFGLNLGIAFQLQDDYLDVFGDPETFGKQIGGDIIENKKTYLFLTALASSNHDKKEKLLDHYMKKTKDNKQKIGEVKMIFVSSGADQKTKEAIKNYTDKAFKILDTLLVPDDKKLVLRQFGENLMQRDV